MSLYWTSRTWKGGDLELTFNGVGEGRGVRWLPATIGYPTLRRINSVTGDAGDTAFIQAGQAPLKRRFRTSSSRSSALKILELRQTVQRMTPVALHAAVATRGAAGAASCTFLPGLIIASGVRLEVSCPYPWTGNENTTIKAPAAANEDVLVGENAYTLFTGDTSVGIANGVSGPHDPWQEREPDGCPSRHRCLQRLAFYGYNHTIENVRIQNFSVTASDRTIIRSWRGGSAC